ncbi:MAG: BsaA family SipW-dependent biofilm matrix protein [Clostridium sp.]
MSKKKIATLLLAGALVIAVVGGTFAWFTAKDSVVNKFTTGTTEDKTDPDAGIKVQEEWVEKEGENLTPGAEINKDVQARSTASYDQFVRVKFDKVWKDIDGTEVTTVTLKGITYNLETSKIVLNLRSANVTTIGTQNTWVDGADGYYYYIGKVAGGSYTNTLLDSVTFDKASGNEYKNLKFDVKVTAESIQASHGAYAAVWAAAPESIRNLLKDYETKPATAPTNAAEPDGLK